MYAHVHIPLHSPNTSHAYTHIHIATNTNARHTYNRARTYIHINSSCVSTCICEHMCVWWRIVRCCTCKIDKTHSMNERNIEMEEMRQLLLTFRQHLISTRINTESKRKTGCCYSLDSRSQRNTLIFLLSLSHCTLFLCSHHV